MELPHEQCNYPHCDCGSMDFCLQAHMASEPQADEAASVEARDTVQEPQATERNLGPEGDPNLGERAEQTVRLVTETERTKSSFVNSKQSWQGPGWCDVCEGYADDLLINTQGVGVCEPCMRS